MKKLLVTSALPYANGPIHLGHLVEYCQTDIWARYWRLRGRDVLYVCADDTHGTPIMIRAREEGITPEALIGRFRQEHLRDFNDFDIQFDNYYTTHSEENRQFATAIYERLKENGHLVEKAIEQAHCDHCGIFLPDRYIRGICPHCSAPNQYGDNCERCAKTYSPRELIAPSCAQCGKAPEWRTTHHLFFRLEDLNAPLRQWVEKGVPEAVANKLEEWFQTGLRDWDITRDAPYFGFEIPDRPGQYFYVWLDAPVGYMAATADWCRTHGVDFDAYWKSQETEIVHFIGKDIVYFHALFWPALLMGSGLFRPPDRLAIHGFLTVGGEKMSKSRGTFITAETYLKHLDPQFLRYYYATKLSARQDDLDLNVEDFVARINSDLVGKIANIPSRILAILHGSLGGRLGTLDAKGIALVDQVRAQRDAVANLYEEREFSQVTRHLLEIAGWINAYIEEQKPWWLAKEAPDEARNTCAAALNAYKILATLIQPILPRFARAMAEVLGQESLSWQGMDEVIEDRTVTPYTRVVDRMQLETTTAILNKSKNS